MNSRVRLYFLSVNRKKVRVFDDNDVLINTTQAALPKQGNTGKPVATWVQENQFIARTMATRFARDVLEISPH